MGNYEKRSGSDAALVLLVGLALLVLFAPLPVSATIPVERTFRIEASRFQYSPAVLQVNPGDRVTIDLVAQDVVHGMSIDGYNLAITADPGQTAHLSFIADRPGSFRIPLFGDLWQPAPLHDRQTRGRAEQVVLAGSSVGFSGACGWSNEDYGNEPPS